MSLKSSIHTISSLDLPELEPYRTLRRPLDHQKAGIFVAEGEKVVRRLLASSLTINSFLLTPQWLTALDSELHLRFKEAVPPIYVAEQELLESIVGHNLHQGIMAIARIPAHRTLPEALNEVHTPHLLLALDGLVNSENVGVAVRNSAAFGVDAIVVGETSSSPYLRRAVRNSMGAVFQIPIVHVDNLKESLQTLAEKYKTRIIAAHPRGRKSIQEADFLGNICIVFGNEGEGISEEVLSVCDQTIGIPMLNETDSLNVSSASAVFLYEARKQRGGGRTELPFCP